MSFYSGWSLAAHSTFSSATNLVQFHSELRLIVEVNCRDADAILA